MTISNNSSVAKLGLSIKLQLLPNISHQLIIHLTEAKMRSLVIAAVGVFAAVKAYPDTTGLPDYDYSTGPAAREGYDYSTGSPDYDYSTGPAVREDYDYSTGSPDYDYSTASPDYDYSTEQPDYDYSTGAAGTEDYDYSYTTGPPESKDNFYALYNFIQARFFW